MFAVSAAALADAPEALEAEVPLTVRCYTARADLASAHLVEDWVA